MQLNKRQSLIEIDDKGKFLLNTETASIIDSLEGPIKIVSIVGPYRSGKSFLLNRLIGSHEAFDVGNTTFACTKGLWIFITIKNNETQIVTDSEGLDSGKRSREVDLLIQCLTVLCSSTLILNVREVVGSQLVEKLSQVVKAIQTLCKDCSGIDPSFQPKLMILVRDFQLELKSKDGIPLSLESQLEQEILHEIQDFSEMNEGAISECKYRNEVIKLIRDQFRDRELHVMIKPLQKDLTKVNSLPQEKLRPEFRSQCDAFINSVYEKSRPKRIAKAPINGKTQLFQLDSIVKSVNSNNFVNLNDSIQQALNYDTEQQTYKSLIDFKEAINLINIPIPDSELTSEIQPLKNRFMEQYIVKIINNTQSDLNSKDFIQVQTEYEKELDIIVNEYKEKNLIKIFDDKKEKITSIEMNQNSKFDDTFDTFDKNIDKITQQSDDVKNVYTFVKDNFEKYLEEVEDTIEGDKIVEMVIQNMQNKSNLLNSKLTNLIVKIINRVNNESRTKINEKNSKIESLEIEIKNHKESFQREISFQKEKNEQEVDTLKQKLKESEQNVEKLQSDLQNDKQNSKLEITKLMQKISDLETQRVKQENEDILKTKMTNDGSKSASSIPQSDVLPQVQNMFKELKELKTRDILYEHKLENAAKMAQIDKQYQNVFNDLKVSSEAMTEKMKRRQEDEIASFKAKFDEQVKKITDLENENQLLRIKHSYLEHRITKLTEVQEIRSTYDGLLMDSWSEILGYMKDQGKGNTKLEGKIDQVKNKINKTNQLK